MEIIFVYDVQHSNSAKNINAIFVETYSWQLRRFDRSIHIIETVIFVKKKRASDNRISGNITKLTQIIKYFNK